MLVSYMQIEYLCGIKILIKNKNTYKNIMETLKKKTVREMLGEISVGQVVRLEGVHTGTVQAACSHLKREEGKAFITKAEGEGVIVVRVK